MIEPGRGRPEVTDPRHTIVVDLGYGDAGKGTVVDRLCATRPVHAVIRFNGGAQAGHNVVTPDGRHHTFSQFGSGTFHPGVRTHLSRFVVVDPLALTGEAEHLRTLGVTDAYERLSVDRDALLATPYHRLANHTRERARGGNRHGSCGMGVGETVAFGLVHPDDAPRADDALDPDRLRRKLTTVRDVLTTELGPLGGPPIEACVEAFTGFGSRVSIVDGATERAALLRDGVCVFEGAQGVLLDEWYGFHPYTTWSTTTFANAETLLAEAGSPGDASRLGVLRVYTTRHGAGPLVTEDAALSAAMPDPHNGYGPWQGAFRVGYFDAVAHRYALAVAGGADALALTHLDVAPDRLCRSYELDGSIVDTLPIGRFGDLDHQATLTERLLRARPRPQPVGTTGWPDIVTDALGCPVVLTSHGPTSADKTEWVRSGR